MKHEIIAINETKSKISVTVDFEEMKRDFQKEYKKISHNVNIPGFRKGHVPDRIIDQRWGREGIIQEVISRKIPQTLQKIFDENDFIPLGQPNIKVNQTPNSSGVLAGELQYDATINFVPAFDLPKFEEIKLEVSTTNSLEEEVKAELEETRKRFATLEKVSDPINKEHFTTLDIEVISQGDVIDVRNNLSYQVDTEELYPELNENLLGKKTSDFFEYNTILNEGKNKSKHVTIKTKIIEVKQRKLPELDDSFAKLVSEYDSLAELTDNIKSRIERKKKEDQAIEAREKLLNILIETTKIILPQDYIDTETKRIVNEQEATVVSEDASTTHDNQEAGKGNSKSPTDRDSFPVNNYDSKLAETNTDNPTKNLEEVEKEYRDLLKKNLILDKILSQYEVKVSQQELFEYIFQHARATQIDVSKILDDYNQLRNIHSAIAKSKALGKALLRTNIVDTNNNTLDFTELFEPKSSKENNENKEEENDKDNKEDDVA